jgi:hypothetical protein
LFQQQSSLFSEQQNFKIECMKNKVLPGEYVFLKSSRLVSSIYQNKNVKGKRHKICNKLTEISVVVIRIFYAMLKCH